MNPTQLKKLAVNTMIGSLISAAVIAVTIVLVGEFNDTFGKSLFTLFIVTVHALLCLGFLDNRAKTTNSLQLFTNTMFTLIVMSFVTAIFGIWGVFDDSLMLRLYGTYAIVAFAVLHAEMLYKSTGLESRINKIVYSNYALMGLVVALLLPVVWTTGEGFPSFYYRLLAAGAIVDATLTILAVILHRLYLQKHPELTSELFTQTYVIDANGNRISQTVEAPKRRMHPLLAILLLFLLLQFLAPLIFVLSGLFR